MQIVLVGLFLCGAYVYLFWALKRGRISYRQPVGAVHRSVVVDRQDSPVFFWVLWTGSIVSLSIGTVMLVGDYL
jgi:hypothetical protein